VPRPDPAEFRARAVALARAGTEQKQIVKDFGVHPMTLFKWLRQPEVEEGAKPGVSRAKAAELCEARKRIKLLGQDYEVLRRATAYLSQANLAGKGSTRS